jgi:ATP synthase protein I
MSGANSAWFFVLGALCAVVPNALFALRLSFHRGKSAESYPVVFFLGEFLKIGLTLAGLGLIIKSYQGSSTEVAWLALLLGLIIVLKAPLGMWWLERSK